MASKKDQFLQACKQQKLDTLRWAIGAGNQQPSARDDDGYTAIMICASLNKHKALQMLCDWCRRARMREQMDLTDGEGTGKTALMMAAVNGHEESLRELLDAGCDYKKRCENGRTASDYARKKGFEKLGQLIDRGGEESEGDDEEVADEEELVDGETATQRSKRKKKEMQALESANVRGGAKESKKSSADDDGKKKKNDDDDGDDGDDEAPEPIWPEVKKAMKEKAKELTITRTDVDELDPAIFYCKDVNNLKIECGKSLEQLPSKLKKLKGLLTLIVSDNGLTSLPKEIGKLKNLRVLECEGNKLTALPEELAKLQNLEILRLGRNQITDLSILKKMNSLRTLVVDNNRLRTLDNFDIGSKINLITLSANNNEIVDAPTDIGKCPLLEEIRLNKNNIEELPGEWGDLKEKKVREIDLDDNPIKDSKIKKMMGKSDKFVKELLTYVRKNCKKGLTKKAGNAKSSSSKKSSKKAENSDDDVDDDANDKPEVEEVKQEEEEVVTKVVVGEGVTKEDENDDEEVSETESELEERMQAMSKKEKEKFKRKLVEKKAVKAQKLALEKRLKEDAENLKRMEELVISGAGKQNDSDDEDIDSDDEEALLARKQKQKAKAASFMYALTDEQRVEAEKAEAKRIFEKEKAEREAALALKRKEEEAKNMAKNLNAVKLDGDSEAGRYTWIYSNGKFDRSVTTTPPSRGGPDCIECVIPKLICGRLIGKGGATIKAVSERSKVVRVNIDETKGGSGNSLLCLQGSESAMESARMLFNNAI